MFHRFLTLLLALILIPLTFTTSSSQFIVEERVFHWQAVAIEDCLNNNNNHNSSSQIIISYIRTAIVTASVGFPYLSERVVLDGVAPSNSSSSLTPRADHINVNSTSTSKFTSRRQQVSIPSTITCNHPSSPVLRLQQVVASYHLPSPYQQTIITMPQARQTHQERIARERSRAMNRSGYSVASSTGSNHDTNHGTVSPDSTVVDTTQETIDSQWDPVGDGVTSSSNILNVDEIQFQRDQRHNAKVRKLQQKLPELRDSAKKYGRWSPRRQENDVIYNTSAIARAFPDFTQGGSDDAFSLEAPRVDTAYQRQQESTPTRMPLHQQSADFRQSQSNFGLYNVNPAYKLNSTTPPTLPRSQPKASLFQHAVHNARHEKTPPHQYSAEQKENIPPSLQKSANGSPYVSYASRNISGEQRNLADLQAHVNDESNGSIIDSDRPTITLPTRASRFTAPQPQPQKSATVSTRHASDSRPEASKKASDTPSKQSLKRRSIQTTAQNIINHQNVKTTTGNRTVDVNSANPTQHSFYISPGQSKEVTQPGVPVFIEQGKVYPRTSLSGIHGPVDGIETPDDEEDIYETARKLQLQVNELEAERATMTDNHSRERWHWQEEKKEFVTKLRGRGRADSGLGDSGSECSRDSAAQRVQREAEAEHLKNEYVKLGNEITEIREAHAKLTQEYTQVQTEGASTWIQLTTVRKQKFECDQQIVQLQQQLSKIEKQNSDLEQRVANAGRPDAGLEQRNIELEQQVQSLQKRNDSLEKHISSTRKRNTGLEQRNNELEQEMYSLERRNNELEQNISNTGNCTVGLEQRIAEIEQQKHDLEMRLEQQKLSSNRRDIDNEDFTGHISHKSGISRASGKSGVSQMTGMSQVSQLQRDNQELQGKFAALEQVIARISQNPQANIEQEDTRLPRSKSRTSQRPQSAHGMEQDNTGRISLKSGMSQRSHTNRDLQQDDTFTTIKSRTSVKSTKSTQSHRRAYSEGSIQSSKHRLANAEDMTSAYILPDIQSVPQATSKERPVLSSGARGVLDGICKHDTTNCTKCARITAFEDQYEDEPTLRPALPPRHALASVIRGLNEDIVHLKIEHSHVQKEFCGLDAAMSKKRRDILGGRLSKLLLDIQTKSDYVYSLHDAAEGMEETFEGFSAN